MSIRPITLDDVPAVRSLAIDTGMFKPEEAGFVDDMVPGAIDGTMPENHWVVSTDEHGRVRGAAYFAPEPFSDRLWNLYFIAVDPSVQSGGIGGALVNYVVKQLLERGEASARVLLVETSSTEQYKRTRAFYPRHGFVEEARIRDFYGPANDKVVFWRSLL